MNEEEIKAFTLIIEAVEDYINYKHSGDPWEEDARVMQEMFIDSLRPKCENSEVLEICRKAITAYTNQLGGTTDLAPSRQL